MKIIKTICFISSLLAVFFSAGAQIITPPYFDNFEGVNTGWTTDSVTGSNWQLGMPATAPTNSVHSGVNAWDVDLLNVYLPGTECYLLTPDFDFSSITNATLAFWQNRATESGWDGARIDFTTNGGLSWTVLGAINSPNATNWYTSGIASSGQFAWEGNSMGWIKSTFNLSLLNGLGIVKFRFAFNADGTNQVAGFSMDDFEILVPAVFDAGVSSIVEPNNNSQPNSNSPIKVVVTNYGLTAITSMNVGAEINGLIINILPWLGNLSPGASDTVIIGNVIIPIGIYNLCAFTDLINDGYGSNDTLCEFINSASGGITVAVFDSLGYVDCTNPPILDQIYVFGLAPALSNGDSIAIHLAFGDGQDTNYFSIVNNNFFGSFIPHWYLFSGHFSMKAIATAGIYADTAVNYNQLIIADTCGNISGKVYADMNNNCLFDGLDYGITNIPVKLFQAGNLVNTFYSGLNGDFYFVVPSSVVYDLKIDTLYPGINVYCPSSGTINGITEPSLINNFALNPATTFDLEPLVNPFSIRPNTNSILFFSLRNNQFSLLNGSLKLIIDTTIFLTTNIVPPVSAINGDTLIWNVNSIGNVYNNGVFNVSITVSPKITLTTGTTICFQAIAEPGAGDVNSLNNVKTACGLVTNSYDPNNKTVEPSGVGANGNVSPLTSSYNYTVNFQNTGNAPAFNVFILDTIDSSLDINTLLITGSSHLVSADIIAGNVVKFSFDNIFLPDSTTDEAASHGYVAYRILPNAGLADGTQIKNTAFIYFDFNPAVVTNTTLNTIVYSLGLQQAANRNNTLLVFPNPASEVINVLVNQKDVGFLTLTDIYGKQLKVQPSMQGKQQLELKGLSNGIYYLSFSSGSLIITKKIIILK